MKTTLFVLLAFFASVSYAGSLDGRWVADKGLSIQCDRDNTPVSAQAAGVVDFEVVFNDAGGYIGLLSNPAERRAFTIDQDYPGVDFPVAVDGGGNPVFGILYLLRDVFLLFPDVKGVCNVQYRNGRPLPSFLRVLIQRG